jgi:hypothetical protein
MTADVLMWPEFVGGTLDGLDVPEPVRRRGSEVVTEPAAAELVGYDGLSRGELARGTYRAQTFAAANTRLVIFVHEDTPAQEAIDRVFWQAMVCAGAEPPA